MPAECFADPPYHSKTAGDKMWTELDSDSERGLVWQQYSQGLLGKGGKLFREAVHGVEHFEYRVMTKDQPWYVIAESNDHKEIMAAWKEFAEVYQTNDKVRWYVLTESLIVDLENLHEENYQVLVERMEEAAGKTNSAEELLAFYTRVKAIGDEHVNAHALLPLQQRFVNLVRVYLEQFAKCADELEVLRKRMEETSSADNLSPSEQNTLETLRWMVEARISKFKEHHEEVQEYHKTVKETEEQAKASGYDAPKPPPPPPPAKVSLPPAPARKGGPPPPPPPPPPVRKAPAPAGPKAGSSMESMSLKKVEKVERKPVDDPMGNMMAELQKRMAARRQAVTGEEAD